MKNVLVFHVSHCQEKSVWGESLYTLEISSSYHPFLREFQMTFNGGMNIFWMILAKKKQ